MLEMNLTVEQVLKDPKIFSMFRRDNGALLRQFFPRFVEHVLNKTTFVDNDDLSEHLFCFVNKLDSLPGCIQCGGLVKFFRFDKGYKKHCSPECAAKSKKENNLKT